MTNETKHATRKRRDWWVDLTKLLAQLSPENEATATPIMAAMRNNGIKPNSLYAHGMALVHANRTLQGRPFHDASQEDLVRVVADLKTNTRGATPAIYASLLRRFWANMLGVDLDDLPRAIKKGLACRRTRQASAGSVMPDEAFAALLEACRHVMVQRTGLATAERNQALLRTLRRTGFRISECLSLRVGSVSFEAGHLVRLELPHDAPDLKTGPRTVIIHEADDNLQTWLKLHPTPQDKRAPLFPTNGGVKAHLPVAYKTCDDLIRKLQDHAGVRDRNGAYYSLHDLRHTCATEKARLRWSEEQMRRFFGWAPGSSMPSTYIHLNLDDMRNQVAQDAKRRNDEATPTPTIGEGPGDTGRDAALLALARLVKQQLAAA